MLSIMVRTISDGMASVVDGGWSFTAENRIDRNAAMVGDWRTFAFDASVFGALIQYPATDGAIHDYREFCQRAHSADAMVTVAA